MKLQSLLQNAGTAFCMISICGCTVGPDFVRPHHEITQLQPPPHTDDIYSNQLSSTDKIPSEWWKIFNDKLLIELQSRAKLNNLDLQMAVERIEQSRAQLGITSSQLLPNIGSSTSYSREALSQNGKFAALGAPTKASDFWQLGFDASWELDLWGRAQRMREGAAASFEATIYDREAVQIALSAELARTYLQLRGTQAQLSIAQQNLEIANRLIKITESRIRNGVATRFETASALAQQATVKAMLPELIQQRNQLMNALALLIGEKPRALDEQLSQTLTLPVLPQHIPIGIPSEFAHQRPDIQRAEAKLHAATAAIGVAKADFYPRIGLRGRVGVEAFEINDLDSWDSRLFSVGPTVYLPIFQGGKLTQRLALNEFRQKEAALAYRQTVLRAWHEVDNALNAWNTQQSHHAELVVSYEQNKQAFQAAERSYQQGIADYMTVLTAQRNLLTAQSQLNTSSTNVAVSIVNLYKSLGGGWDVTSFNTASVIPLSRVNP
ncbi:efflux transporter outer membrane subunit [Acinetobacter radioresistens]|uniref:efflux transporter outer membrane subunit n=1 Tax=Acinetobacter radioresistens TaxID=40216 RepID=UPI002A5A9F1D|nr:efflux transporter outer membrane subunit [Acinetobacter radioresistens]MDY0842529.1 efflux transporter outer membrane subunit [Acinetobacter radioresistens]